MESEPVRPTLATPSERRIRRVMRPGSTNWLAILYPKRRPSSALVEPSGWSLEIAARIASLFSPLVGSRTTLPRDP